jgi:hypothetical protein
MEQSQKGGRAKAIAGSHTCVTSTSLGNREVGGLSEGGVQREEVGRSEELFTLRGVVGGGGGGGGEGVRMRSKMRMQQMQMRRAEEKLN